MFTNVEKDWFVNGEFGVEPFTSYKTAW
jgi:hypothetical protein